MREADTGPRREVELMRGGRADAPPGVRNPCAEGLRAPRSRGGAHGQGYEPDAGPHRHVPGHGERNGRGRTEAAQRPGRSGRGRTHERAPASSGEDTGRGRQRFPPSFSASSGRGSFMLREGTTVEIACL